MQLRSGNVILAEPFMEDRNFHRTAVLLCEHHIDGSVGFIMNKPLGMNVDELISDFPEFNSEVRFGGPVATDTIHYIHRLGNLIEDSTKVMDGIWWGGSFEKLKFLIASELVRPEDIRFFVGYSGWASGQLEHELEIGSWVIADMDANYLFKSKPSRVWQQVMHNKGSVYTVLAQLPESNSWN